MFDALKRKLAGSVMTDLLKSLAKSQDTHTTITGLIAAAVLAVPGFDPAKILAGDIPEIARVVAALLVAVIGYYATKPGKDGMTTALGAIAGALYSVQGDITSVATGATIFVLGHLTNKVVAQKT